MQNNDQMKDRIEVFISYAPEDKSFRDKLDTRLRILQSLKIIDTWDDQAIIAGTEWRSEISRHLEKASIILLLISPDSPDFTASEDHISTEIQQAINRHIARKAHVIPILLRSTYLGEEDDELPINKLKFLPTNRIPIIQWPDQDEAFVDVVKGIRKAAEHLKTQSQQRKSALFGYETQGGSSSPLWNNPDSFTPNEDYQKWLKDKRAFIEILNSTWIKVGDHGYSYIINFKKDGELLERPLLDQEKQVHGSWKLLENGILRTNIEQDEDGVLVKYELDIYANRQRPMHSGIEFRNDMSTPHAYFVLLPLQSSDASPYFDKALIAFEQLLRINPNAAQAYKGKGDILRKLKRHEEALEAYRRAIELDSDYMWAWYEKGEVLRELQRFEEALKAYKRSTELNPDNIWPWYNMGKVLYELERYEEAIVAYEQAQLRKPDFANLYASKGNAFYCLLRYKEALDSYEQAPLLGYHPFNSFRYEIVKELNALGLIELVPQQHNSTPDGEGWFWHYPEKSAYWSYETGIYATQGEIRGKWASLVWERGLLGYPVSEQRPTADSKGLYQHFQRGSIFWSEETGAHSVDGLICEKWASLDWERGLLGYPRTDAEYLPDGVGRHCHFQHGCIYWSPDTGAHEVHGIIREKWATLGWEQSFLGYPTGDEKGSPDGIGRISNFQHGSVYWTPGTGANAVHKAIYKKWKSVGWEEGLLGYPIADDQDLPDSSGRLSTFQHGFLYWNPKTGTYILHDKIGERWVKLRLTSGILKYPISDQEPTADGKGLYQHFQRGSIFWSEETGAWEVYGAIRDQWKKLNWERGILGYPTTGEMGAADGKGRYSHFQHGLIYYHGDVDLSAHEVYGAIREKWASLGWEQSFLGYPATGQGTAPDDIGQISYFQQGAIYWSEAGGAVVFKGSGKNLRERFQDRQVFTQMLERVKKQRPEVLSMVVYHIDHPGKKNVGYYRLGRNVDANGIAAGGWSKRITLRFLEAKDHEGSGIALLDLDGGEFPALLVFRVDHAEDKNRGYYRIGKNVQIDGTIVGDWSEAIRVPDPFGKHNLGGGIALADLNKSGRPDLLVFYVVASGEKKEGFYRIGWDLDGDGLVTGGWSEPVQIPVDFGNEQNCVGIALADLDGNGQLDLILFSIEHHEHGNTGFYYIGKHLDSKGLVTGGWRAPVQIPGTFGAQNHGASLAVTDLNRNGRADLVVFYIEHYKERSTDQNSGYYRIGRNLDTNGYATGGWTDPLEVPGWFGSRNQGAGIAFTTSL